MTKGENEKIKEEAVATSKKTSKSTTTKKASTKAKSTARSTTKKTTTSKSTTSKKSTTKNRAAKKSTPRKKKPDNTIIEYYDLPSTYNQTTVKLLFQTPKKLFVYWEISEEDKQKYFAENGKDFFEATTPFLVVTNKTKNYTFEVEVNDFANSWYFDVPDSNCEYEVALVRKHKITNVPTPITSSNNLEVPNNKILFEQNRKEIFFKNVKTDDVVSKSVVNLQFINHLGNVINANSFYKKFYKEEDLNERLNPSS